MSARGSQAIFPAPTSTEYVYTEWILSGDLRSLDLSKLPKPFSKWHMQFLRLHFFTIFFCVLTAHADLTIVQKVEGAGPISDITIKIKGDKARIEAGPKVITIIDSKTGDITNLLNDQKKVIRISGEKAKAIAEMARKFINKKEVLAQATKPKATGKKETIDGYETEEYVTDTPNYHATYWIATKYPDYPAILGQMEVMQNGAFESVRKGMPDYRDFPGLPLRSRVKMEGQVEITSTIVSINQNALSESDFAVPAGYEEMKMPNFTSPNPSPGGAKPVDQSEKKPSDQ